MKMVMFVGEVLPHANEVMEFLKKDGYVVLKTMLADEVDQMGQQIGLGLLVFTDANFAYRFLCENTWPFPRFNAVYLPKKPKLNPEVQRKLDSVDLKLFDPSTKELLLKALSEFKPGGGSADGLDIEIEFSVNEDLKKES